MSLFSTGYLSLSEEDIKILKKPSDINKNNKYCKIMTNSYKVVLINIFPFGGSFMLIFLPTYFIKEKNVKL